MSCFYRLGGFIFVDAEARVCESDLPVGTNKETLNFGLVTTR